MPTAPAPKQRGRFYIEGCAALANLDGLPALDTVEENLRLFGNLGLTDISALSGITHVGGNVEIEANPVLSSAHAQSVVGDFDYVGGAVVIVNNAP